jgi:hypothetical protein
MIGDDSCQKHTDRQLLATCCEWVCRVSVCSRSLLQRSMEPSSSRALQILRGVFYGAIAGAAVYNVFYAIHFYANGDYERGASHSLSSTLS